MSFLKIQRPKVYTNGKIFRYPIEWGQIFNINIYIYIYTYIYIKEMYKTTPWVSLL